jgi:Transposase C of IS166 homeodomain
MQFARSSEKLDRQIEQVEPRLEELQTSQAEKTGPTLLREHPFQPASESTRAAVFAGAPAA